MATITLRDFNQEKLGILTPVELIGPIVAHRGLECAKEGSSVVITIKEINDNVHRLIDALSPYARLIMLEDTPKNG